MKVLVFTAHTTWVPHFETDLELIQRHLDAGDEVIHLHCDGAMPACDGNPQHRVGGCAYCIQKRNRGLSLLSQPIVSLSFTNLTDADRQEMAALRTEFSSIKDMNAYRVDNFDIGRAVLSSIISITRDPYPDVRAYADLIRRFLVAAFAVYRSVQRHLDQLGVERVYVFNGRFAPLRAAFRACQSRGVKCVIHEVGHNVGYYALYEDETPHSLAYVANQIRQHWQAAVANPEREKIAAAFYEERARGSPLWWRSFVKAQTPGLLPADWNPAKRNIAIFTSSEEEFTAVDDDWKNPLYSDQYDGLVKIVNTLRERSHNLHLYVRVHPYLAGVNNPYMQESLRLRADCLTIIKPEDPVSTYALLHHADKVLTFGSTVGIEAVYWGRPSVLAGRMWYQDFGGTYNPASHDELIDLLQADLKPRDREAALIFGYYLKTFGSPFRYFKFTGHCQGEFRGRSTDIHSFWRTMPRLLRHVPGLRRLANSVFQSLSRRRIGAGATGRPGL